MYDNVAETLYLEHRVSDSRALAVTATEPCARIAHMRLAKLYEEAMVTLVAKLGRPYV